MVDLTDPKAAKREIEQEAYRYYEQLSGNQLARRADGSFLAQGHNDELDAFRHAYTSGRVTQIALGQQWMARMYGDDAEIGPAHRNDPYEHRMDLWNNEVGRRVGDRTNNAGELAQQAFAELKRGELVVGLDDSRLRQLYPDDPRLRRPDGDPEREMVDSKDVDLINTDIARIQKQARQSFPADHADHGYFTALRNLLPSEIPDAKVAQTLVAAKDAGMVRPEQVASVAVHEGQIFVMGNTPGFRARVDLGAPAPDVRESAYEADKQNLIRGYDEQAGAQRPNEPHGRGIAH